MDMSILNLPLQHLKTENNICTSPQSNQSNLSHHSKINDQINDLSTIKNSEKMNNNINNKPETPISEIVSQ